MKTCAFYYAHTHYMHVTLHIPHIKEILGNTQSFNQPKSRYVQIRFIYLFIYFLFFFQFDLQI